MATLHKFIERINTEAKFSGELKYDETMSAHTSFKLGGKADIWLRPDKEIFQSYAAKLLASAREEAVPVFVLGAGANIVVSDRGIRGIVLDKGAYTGIIPEKDSETYDKDARDTEIRTVLSGTQVDWLVGSLAEEGLSGMEFLAGMPGSVGGAVWMNARCYGKSISDVLFKTEVLDESFQVKNVPFIAEDFDYKKSPFQGQENLILSASFALRQTAKGEIFKEIAFNRQDRVEKGHYRFPSAGSAFKNNPIFGEPTGKIIDELGLRGFSLGGAQVAPWHGNIVINSGKATAADVKNLIHELLKRVKEEKGFELESEILFVGDW